MLSAEVVTVAMLTFHRLDDVAEALPMLLAQAREVEQGSRGRYRVEVLVVDNDPAAGARDVVTAAPGTVRYRVEATPGISAARNRALSESEGSDVLVFIDDDERPRPGWLAALLAARERYGAAAVTGPVVSRFDGELDAWVVAGGFYDRSHRDGTATGERLQQAATNNLLLDLHVVRQLGLTFDPRLGTTGGEDTLFSSELVKGGATVVWCAEAVVEDRVPAHRMSRDYVLRRTRSLSSTAAVVQTMLADSPAGRARRRVAFLLVGCARVLLGGGRTVLGRLRRSARDEAHGMRLLARGLGNVQGSFGRVPEVYGRAPAHQDPPR